MKKIVSVIMSLVLALSVFGISAYAGVETATDAPVSSEISEINLSADFDIGGTDVIDVEEYLTIETDGVEFVKTGIAAMANKLYSQTFEETFFEGEVYAIGIYLDLEEGYTFEDVENVTAYVNGTKVYCEAYTYYSETKNAEVYTCSIIMAAAIGPEGRIVEGKNENLIREIDLDVAPVAGMTAGEWENYVTINTENVSFNDGEGFKGAFVYKASDLIPLPENYVFEAGEEYIVEVQLVADDGYCFPYLGLDGVTVNGEETEGIIVSYTLDGTTYTDVAVAITTEVPEGENEFFDYVINFFAEIKAKFEFYFLILFALFLI